MAIEESTQCGEETDPPEEKKGKTFASLEEAEKAYNHLNSAFSKKENFEKKYAARCMPEEYTTPQELAEYSDAHVQECAKRAKKLELSQVQFEKLVVDTPVTPPKKNVFSDIGISDATFEKMSDAEIAALQKLSSPGTAPLVSPTRSFHTGANAADEKRKARVEMQKARARGDRRAEMEARDKWLSYTGD